MLKRLKELFSASEPREAREVTLEEVGPLLEREESHWQERLGEEMGPLRKEFAEISSHLLERVSVLSGSDSGGAFHPKLEKIARNSLPQFTKAMMLALQRRIPEDPLAFYESAAESLKGCVKAVAGPGRYLGSAFPEQMREIRALVDDMGRLVNRMTPLVAGRRNRGLALDRARVMLGALREKQSALAGAREQLSVLLSRRGDLGKKYDDLVREKEACDRRAGTDGSLQAALRERDAAGERVAEIRREIQKTASTLARVFSKAEKIFQKRGGVQGDLKSVTEALSWDPGGIGEETVDRARAVLPIVKSMVRSGDLPLKNREEAALFSSPGNAMRDLSSLVQQRREAERLLAEKEAFIESHPDRSRGSELSRLIREVGSEREKVSERIGELGRRVEEMERDVAKLVDELEGALRALLPWDVRVKR
ncbi:MAG: hypothetical protein QXL43_02105 [Methanolinea sp.]